MAYCVTSHVPVYLPPNQMHYVGPGSVKYSITNFLENFSESVKRTYLYELALNIEIVVVYFPSSKHVMYALLGIYSMIFLALTPNSHDLYNYNLAYRLKEIWIKIL